MKALARFLRKSLERYAKGCADCRDRREKLLQHLRAREARMLERLGLPPQRERDRPPALPRLPRPDRQRDG